MDSDNPDITELITGLINANVFSSVSAKRINEVLETNPHMEDGTIDEDTTGIVGEVSQSEIALYSPFEQYCLLGNVA